MCTMMILQFYSTMKPDESQSTLKFQLIPPYQKHVLAFSLGMETQILGYENSQAPGNHLSCRCHELYWFKPVLF